MGENQTQAPLPPHLFKENDAAQPGRHLQDARDRLTEVDAHSEVSQLEAQCEIAETDGKPGTRTHTERDGARDRGQGRAERGRVGLEKRNKQGDL